MGAEVQQLSLRSQSMKGRHSLQFPLQCAANVAAKPFYVIEKLEARVGIEPTHKGFADLSLTTWVPRLMGNMKREPWLLAWEGWQRHAAGAGDGGRTRDFDLGKVALYH